MLPVTRLVCKGAATVAEAAAAWAKLAPDARLDAECSDCNGKTERCGLWFLKRTQQQKRRKLDVDQHAEIRRRASELLGKACCRTYKDGRRECGQQFCTGALKTKANKRRASILRTMHDSGSVKLSPVQLAATDAIAGHPAQKHCEGGSASSRCLGESLAYHVASKHGIDRDTLDKKLAAVGQSVASILEFSAKRSSKPRQPAASTAGAQRRLSQKSARAATRVAFAPQPFAVHNTTRALLGKIKAVAARRARGAPASHLGTQKGSLRDADGGLLERARNAANSLSELKQRGRKMATHLEAASERRKQRALAADQKRALVEKVVDAAQKKASGGRGIDLHLPWWAEGIDWKSAVQWLVDAAAVVKAREEHEADHGRRLGFHPEGPYDAEHQVRGDGPLSWLLNVRAARSSIGNQLRGSAVQTRRETRSDDDTNILGRMLLEYTEEKPLAGLRNAIELGNRHESPGRRLAESWLGAAATVPAAAARTATRYATYNAASDTRSEEAFRTIVFDTLLCYLYEPEISSSEGSWAGHSLPVFRTQKLCFPAISHLPGRWSSFRELVGINASFDFGDLNYDNACDHEVVDGFVDALGRPSLWLSSLYGSLFRLGEGIDSIRNFESASGSNLTDTEVATFLVCGTSQLGGIFFTAVTFSAVLLSLVCCMPAIACGMLCARTCLWAGGFASDKRRGWTRIETEAAEPAKFPKV
jgi:hypothetical protein